MGKDCFHLILDILVQSKCNFGERKLSNFLKSIIAAIFDFNGCGRLEREKQICTKGAVDGHK